MDCISFLSAIEGIDPAASHGATHATLPLAALRLGASVRAYFGWQFARAGLAAPGCAPVALLAHCLVQQMVTRSYMQRDHLVVLMSGGFGDGEMAAALLDSMPYQQVIICDHGRDAIRIGIEAARARLPADGMSQRVQYVHNLADALYVLNGRRVGAAHLVEAGPDAAEALRPHAAADGMLLLRAGRDRPALLDGQRRAAVRDYQWSGADGGLHRLGIACEEV